MIDSSMDELWAGLFTEESLDSTDGLIPFFEHQCQAIESSSSGRVHARFKKLELAKRATNAAAFTGVLQASMVGGVVEEEKDALQQVDANQLYEPSDFVFDVFSDKYKFRVLTIHLGMIYPVSFKLDDDIEKELEDDLERFEDFYGMGEGYWIRNDKDLNDLTELIISRSRKFKAILRKMVSEQQVN